MFFRAEQHAPSDSGTQGRSVVQTRHDPRLTTDECIALSDDQLVEKTYDVVCQVMGVDEVAGEALATLVGELLERFAPEAARAELIRLHRDLEALSLVHDALAEDQLLGDLESLGQRQAARLLRDSPDR